MGQEFEAISLEWEKQTGYDSIPTIRRVYEQSPTGAYICVWPKCRFARRNPAKLWRHVHTAHGENSLPPELRNGSKGKQPGNHTSITQ